MVSRWSITLAVSAHLWSSWTKEEWESTRKLKISMVLFFIWQSHHIVLWKDPLELRWQLVCPEELRAATKRAEKSYQGPAKPQSWTDVHGQSANPRVGGAWVARTKTNANGPKSALKGGMWNQRPSGTSQLHRFLVRFCCCCCCCCCQFFISFIQCLYSYSHIHNSQFTSIP